MDNITLIRSTNQRKNPRLVIFTIEGRQGSVQFFRTLFAKDGVPAKLTLTGTFAPPRVKETTEERKARLKARRAAAASKHSRQGCNQAPLPGRDARGSGTAHPFTLAKRTRRALGATVPQPMQRR